MAATKTKTQTAPTGTPARDLFEQPDDTPLATTALEPVPHEVLEDEARDREIHARMSSLMAQAHLEPAKIKNILDNRELILLRARTATIKASKPLDWTLWKGPEGDVVATPRDSLMVNAKKIYGIRITNYRPVGPDGAEPKIETTDDFVMERAQQGGGNQPKVHNGNKIPIYTATLWADGSCHLTGEELPDQTYTARTGRFGGQELYLSDLKQSCRTGLDKLICSKLTGIRKVAGDELCSITGDAKFLERCYKGSGFGSSSERTSAKVAEAGVEEQRAALMVDVLRVCGGDKEAARKLIVDITKNEAKGFKGFDTLDRMTLGWQIEAARKALKAHPVFGDDKPPAK